MQHLLCPSTVFLTLFFLFTPSPVFAQTASELEAQIAVLKKQMEILQQQLNALQSTSSVVPVTSVIIPTTHVINMDMMMYEEEGGFSEPKIIIKKGDSITWKNMGSMPHTVTSDNGVFDSGNMNVGDMFTYTFNEVGEFPYSCRYHKMMGMVGNVVVQEVAPPATTITSHVTPVVTYTTQHDQFQRSLTTGDTGIDVKKLQEVLNTDQRTQVAKVGPGSPGNETAYFGSLTKKAVVTFQNIFKTQILTPIGLINGTGYVGPSTRKILNKLLEPSVSGKTGIQPDASTGMSTDQQVQNIIEELLRTPVEIPETTVVQKTETTVTPKYVSPTAEVIPAPIAQDTSSGISALQDISAFELSFSSNPEDPLDIYYLSLYMGRPGDVVTLFGTGFISTGNSVHFGGGHVIDGLTTTNIAQLNFTVPDLPPGRYAIFVSNRKGKADARFFRILNETIVSAPRITNISPSQGKEGTKVTVIGSSFTSTGNTIFTTYDIIEDVPSHDGVTLTFTIPLTRVGLSAEELLGLTGERLPLPESFEPSPLYIYVENNNGISSDAVFYIENS